MAGAILGAGALSIAGSGISAAIKSKAAKTAFKRARKFRQTAYQDTVRDLRLAGLNPILAFGRGPTAGTTFAPAQVPEFGQGLSTTALSAMKVRSEISVMRALADKARSEAGLARGRTGKVELEVKEFKPSFGGVARRFLESDAAKRVGRGILDAPKWILDRLKSAADR